MSTCNRPGGCGASRVTRGRSGLTTIGACVLLAAGAGGCTSKKAAAIAASDPATVLRNGEVELPERLAAVDRLWAASRTGAPAPGSDAAANATTATSREPLKSVAWLARLPSPVRIHAMELLLSDPGDPDQADTRGMMKLILPVEPDMAVIAFIAQTAGARGWQDFEGPLVRSWSRRVTVPHDDERPERAALVALHASDAERASPESILFRVFSTPAAGEGRELERAEKARMGAWEVLSRIDTDGHVRAALLDAFAPAAGPVAAAAKPDRLIEDLRAARKDLGSLPLTTSQLEWLRQLRDTSDPQRGSTRAAWWAKASAAIATLGPEQRAGLALRHAEGVRLASQLHPEWLTQDRATHIRALRAGLTGKAKSTRNGGRDNGVSDSFFDNEGRLAWGDLVNIRLLHEALAPVAMQRVLLTQAEQDRADTSTEYGGLLRWLPDTSSSGDGDFEARLYPPRATQRTGDTAFIASDDMLRDGAIALAHYHFHAQREDNAEYAGPGPGDVAYALDQGRACVVFTSVRRGRLNASYYQPGVVINLGDVIGPLP